MMPHIVRAAPVAILVLASVVGRGTTAQQVPFQAGADAVILDVSVRSGGHPVTGLAPSDFIVVDNGVIQQVDAASIENLPVDMTFVVDTSIEAVVHQRVGSFVSEIQKIGALLGPGDRVRVLADSSSVTPLALPGPIPMGGPSAAYDACVMALVQPPVTGRRQVVVDFTEGMDYVSVTKPADVVAVAKRADAVLFIVTSKVFTGGSPGVGALVLSRGADALREAARQTGGDWRDLHGNVVATAKSILDDFRNGYLVAYSPTGVGRAGWHDLSVTIRRPGSFQVSTRKGYAGS